jgi:two-component sensor histidine kinase
VPVELISNVFKHAFPGGTGCEVSVALENDPVTEFQINFKV